MFYIILTFAHLLQFLTLVGLYKSQWSTVSASPRKKVGKEVPGNRHLRKQPFLLFWSSACQSLKRNKAMPFIWKLISNKLHKNKLQKNCRFVSHYLQARARPGYGNRISEVCAKFQRVSIVRFGEFRRLVNLPVSTRDLQNRVNMVSLM